VVPLLLTLTSDKGISIVIQPTSKVLALVFIIFALPMQLYAAGDLTRQEPILINVQLGNVNNAHAFVPDTINLETGKLYRLVFTNPSDHPHYFNSVSMAQSVFTRKVQVNDTDGKAIAEIKGYVNEIEVFPGGETEWWFVPVKTGNFDDLKCTIAGHTEAGMVGTINIR
jgi:uncharacterized cupredoxin-like copper-binding protein